ncbi:MAG: hypothetical protein II453_13290 [Alphaproteobacteria bacterium]|nr:hypothetical protein [Alphaproteobacteria bacterium]
MKQQFKKTALNGVNKNTRTSKVMLVSYLGSKSSDEWIAPLVEVCNRLQRKSPVWSYDGLGKSHQQFKPMIDLYATSINKGEHCIIMNATEPCTMKSLIEELLDTCESAKETEIVTDCNISIFTPQQERSYGDLLEDLDVQSVTEAISAVGDDEEHFMQNLLNIVMEKPACAKFYFANFFAEKDCDDEVYTLLFSAADDNYKPAVAFMNDFGKAMAARNGK